MTDIEIRLQLLNNSRDILFRHWEEKLFVEKATALFENRVPKVVAPPTLRKIMKVAEEMYGFLQGPAADVVEPGPIDLADEISPDEAAG